MEEAPLEAPSSREVSFEPASTQAEESEMEEEGDDISEDGQPQEEEKDVFNPITAPQGVHSTKGTTSGTQRSSKGKEIQSRSNSAFERQNSSTRGSSKSQSVSATKKTSEPCHMKRGTHTEKKIATGRNPNDSDDPSGEEYNIDDNGSDRGRKSDQGRRPDQEEEAEETDRSVREITPSMAEWEKVTGQKQFIRKKSRQVSRARGLAKIKDPENCDGKSQQWRDPITFDQ